MWTIQKRFTIKGAKIMMSKRMICGGWMCDLGSGFLHEDNIFLGKGENKMAICNKHIPWSYELFKSEGELNPVYAYGFNKGRTMSCNSYLVDFVNVEYYSQLVRKFGIKLFDGAPVDFDPNSVAKGFYYNYTTLNLYKNIFKNDSIVQRGVYVDSYECTKFEEGIKVLHYLGELPQKWNQYEMLLGSGWKNYDVKYTNENGEDEYYYLKLEPTSF